LQQITKLLQSGEYTGNLGVPSKVVHVGHSYGSFLINALLAAAPNLSDGAILTGTAYGQSKSVFWASWSLRIASEQVSPRWTGRDSGYLTWVDEVANAATFFHGGSYDPKALQYSEDNKQPLAAIELLTRSQLPLTSLDYTGPLMVMYFLLDLLINC
jgi:pimeloyl-ACP methyl ester carboxylesterase